MHRQMKNENVAEMVCTKQMANENVAENGMYKRHISFVWFT